MASVFRLFNVVVSLAVVAFAQSATALTITPLFDSSLTSAANATQLEGAINSAITTIDSLYSNTGTVQIVFKESSSSSYLGTSQTQDVAGSYASYKADLAAVANGSNTVLATALANLSKGNDANGAKPILLTTADARIALRQANVAGAYSCTGISGCAGSYDGTITISNFYALAYGTTPVANAYSALGIVEHEINEILGIGGQGSVLNGLASTTPSVSAAYSNYIGPLDLYRYSAPNTPSLSTSSSTTAYFSVDGGTTNIVGFNQSSAGDYGDWSTHNNVQSSGSNSGLVPTYNTSSPEYLALLSLGYQPMPVPEPATLALLVVGLAGLKASRRQRIQ